MFLLSFGTLFVASPGHDAVYVRQADGHLKMLSGNPAIRTRVSAILPDGSGAYADPRGGAIHFDNLPTLTFEGSVIPRPLVIAMKSAVPEQIVFAATDGRLYRATIEEGAWNCAAIDANAPSGLAHPRARIEIGSDGRIVWLSAGTIRYEGDKGGFEALPAVLADWFALGPDDRILAYDRVGSGARYSIFSRNGVLEYNAPEGQLGALAAHAFAASWGEDPPLAIASVDGLLFADEPTTPTLRRVAVPAPGPQEENPFPGTFRIGPGGDGEWLLEASPTGELFELDADAGTIAQRHSAVVGGGPLLRGPAALAASEAGLFVLDDPNGAPRIVQIDPHNGDRRIHAQLPRGIYAPYLAAAPGGGHVVVQLEANAEDPTRVTALRVTASGSEVLFESEGRGGFLDVATGADGTPIFLASSYSAPSWSGEPFEGRTTQRYAFRAAPASVYAAGASFFVTATIDLSGFDDTEGTAASLEILMQNAVNVYQMSEQVYWLRMEAGPSVLELGQQLSTAPPIVDSLIPTADSDRRRTSFPVRLLLPEAADSMSVTIRTTRLFASGTPTTNFTEFGTQLDRTPGATIIARAGDTMWHLAPAGMRLTGLSATTSRHTVDAPEGFGAADMVADADGALYIASRSATPRVYRFDPATGEGAVFAEAPQQFGIPQALQLSGAGSSLAIGSPPEEIPGFSEGWLLR